MKQSPFENRNLAKDLLWPTMSWSSYQAFTWTDRHTTADQAHEKWYEAYVLMKRLPEHCLPGQITAGMKIGRLLESDPTYLPEVPRLEIYEYNITAKLGKIILVGHLDGFSPSTNELLEYKSTQSKTYWNKKSVAEHCQLDMYCLLLWLKFKIKPEDIRIRLVSIPVIEHGDFQVHRSKEPITIFETIRTMQDILLFAGKIKKVYKEMEEYVKTK